jgi:hypothetical protein
MDRKFGWIESKLMNKLKLIYPHYVITIRVDNPYTDYHKEWI